jgi:hypothetical protein
MWNKVPPNYVRVICGAHLGMIFALGSHILHLSRFDKITVIGANEKNPATW